MLPTIHRAFSLMAGTHISLLEQKKCFHKKRVQLPHDWCSHITVFISKLTPTSISGVRFTSTSELIRRFARIKIYKH